MTTSIIILSTVLVLPCAAQVFLMTGSPTPKGNETFAASLFRLGEDGSLKLIRELVQEKEGTDWIASPSLFRALKWHGCAVSLSTSLLARSMLRAVVHHWMQAPAAPSGERALAGWVPT